MGFPYSRPMWHKEEVGRRRKVMSFQNLMNIFYAITALAVLADLWQVVRPCYINFLKGWRLAGGGFKWFSETTTSELAWSSYRWIMYDDPVFPVETSRFRKWALSALVIVVISIVALITFPIRLYNRCRMYWGKTAIVAGGIIMIAMIRYFMTHPHIWRKVEDWIVFGFVCLLCLMFIGGIARFLVWTGSLVKKIYRKFRPLPPAPTKPLKPTICKNTRDHITVICRKDTYEEALRWHREAVIKGYRAQSEKIVVHSFIYYDNSVSVGQKERHLSSGELAQYEDTIKPFVWIEEHPDIYVPFTSENVKRWDVDKEIFRPNRQMHIEARASILD